MIKRLLPLLVTAAGLMLAGNVFAADPVQMTVDGVEERIGGMTMNVTVTDDTGEESSLAPEDVRAYVDGKSLRVASVEKTDWGRQPASIVLLVDVSGSMYGEPIVQAQAAVRDFISQVEPDDRISIMSFSTGVTLLQDFTTDRSVLDGAAGSLTAFGDTALYGAVNAAIEQANTAPEGGRLVVLLSDGVATEGVENRDASLSMAEESNITFVAVGLGPSVDVDYLRALTTVTGGRYVPTASAAQLRATYSEIATNVVRRYFSDYTMEFETPPTIDRTINSVVKLETAVRSTILSAELDIGPLDGAVPPPYEVRISGIESGGKLAEPATAGVIAPEGREIRQVEFLLEDEVIGSGEGAAATFALDPAGYETGVYTFAVRTVDAKGGQGYGEVSFQVLPAAVAPPPPTEPASLPILPIALVLAALVIAYLLYRLIKARLARAPEYVTRSLAPEPAEKLEAATAAGSFARPARNRAAQQPTPPRGRVVVLRESAIAAGDLHTTREYELRDTPLTIGTGSHVDIRLEDDTGLIAEEEARIWIQRGRVTLHRLTALSSMATAGVTLGWELFSDGEELRLGPYRLVFQVESYRPETEPAGPKPNIEMPPDGLPAEYGGAVSQEHGMTLRPSDR